MRHILLILTLVVTAWVFLPGAAQAHGGLHAPTAAPACAACVASAGAATPDLPPDIAAQHACHHGMSCAGHALPATSPAMIRPPATPRPLRPEPGSALRSVMLTQDLPPPRP